MTKRRQYPAAVVPAGVWLDRLIHKSPAFQASVTENLAAINARQDPPTFNKRLPHTPERADLIQRAFLLEWLTVGWMVVEAAVAIGSGVIAGSLMLTAFGFDSVIELLSAGVLLWRLRDELRRGEEFSQRAERIASRTGGALLFVLAAYIVVGAAWSLWTHHGGEFSVPGLAVAIVAMPVMYVLARQKLDVARQLDSRAMRADAIESITCGWLSLVVVVGLVAHLLLAAWWIDAVTSLGIVWFVLKEAREAWTGDECCTHA
jgi:divalent metal cation (Fe/Co/Zn/Cd) transporter